MTARSLVYDLHIHSCLSPCASNDMTPSNIAGMAYLAGVEVVSVCDHNSALNLPAVQAKCDEYGVLLLPGIEANTAEEIHMLCYFGSVEAALSMGELLYAKLPAIPCKEEYFGEQIIMNSEDEETARLPHLLLNATALTLDETVRETENRGGVCIPAHIDRTSDSIVSSLGLMPEEPHFAAVELAHEEKREEFLQAGHISADTEILISSDAHYLENIAPVRREIGENSVLWPLILKVKEDFKLRK